MSLDLVGIDVSAFIWTPNGTDGYAGLGADYNLLGRYQDFTLNYDLTRSDTTPSTQGLAQKRLTKFDWSINCKNLIQVGGGYGLFAMHNGQFNVKLVWQEEPNGAYITAYGGFTKVSINRGRDVGIETLDIENVGPIGNSGSSIFRTYGGPVSVAQSEVASIRPATVTATTFATMTAAPSLSTLGGGFGHP